MDGCWNEQKENGGSTSESRRSTSNMARMTLAADAKMPPSSLRTSKLTARMENEKLNDFLEGLRGGKTGDQREHRLHREGDQHGRVPLQHHHCTREEGHHQDRDQGHLTGEAGTQQEHHLHRGRDLHDRKHHYNILDEHAKKDLIENMINDASREEDLTKNLIKDAVQNLETKPTDEEANVLKTHDASGIGRHLFSSDRERAEVKNRGHPAASSHRIQEARQYRAPNSRLFRIICVDTKEVDNWQRDFDERIFETFTMCQGRFIVKEMKLNEKHPTANFCCVLKKYSRWAGIRGFQQLFGFKNSEQPYPVYNRTSLFRSFDHCVEKVLSSNRSDRTDCRTLTVPTDSFSPGSRLPRSRP